MDCFHSAQELEKKLGEGIKNVRLHKNLSRKLVCERADVSMTALRNLESGNGASIRTLVRIVRVLGRQDWISAIAPQVSINPLFMVRDGTLRKRASRTKGLRP